MILFLIVVVKSFSQSIDILNEEFIQQGHIVGSNEIFRIEADPDVSKKYIGQIETNYYLMQERNHTYGKIIYIQKYYQEYLTYILLLSRKNDTLFVHKISWENLDSQTTLFQMTNKQLECFQIEIFDSFLILDCNENNIDFLYILDMKSQAFTKYYLQQLKHDGFRKVIYLQDRQKIYMIRGNILQAYQFYQLDRIYYLYSKTFDFEEQLLEWTGQLQYLINCIDSNLNKDHDLRYRIYSSDKSIFLNENKMIQLCYRAYLNQCRDIVFVPQIRDVQINNIHLMVRSKNFVYFYFFDNNLSTVINATDQVLTNFFSNQLVIIENNTIKIYIIDSHLQDFVYISNGSLLINYQPKNRFDQFFQNDISKQITKLKDNITVSQGQNQMWLYDFPFIGGQLEYTYESQYLNISINHILYLDEINCEQVFLILKVKYFLYCLVGNQLNIYESNQNSKFQKVSMETINGTIVEVYSHANQICINIFSSSTKIICKQIYSNISYIYEHQQKVIGIGLGGFLWLNVSTIHINQYSWTQANSFDSPYLVKYENEIIIVLCQIQISILIKTIDYYHQVIRINKCQDFVDFICLKFYCVQICQTKIKKYAILNNYLLYCGKINLYQMALNKLMKVTSSQVDYFYVWDDEQILVFSANRPINQGFVTTIKNFYNIRNLVAYQSLFCIQVVKTYQCFLMSLYMKIELNESLYNNQDINRICAQNHYDKLCINIFVQQYKRDKSLRLRDKQILVKVQQNQSIINLGSDFYVGNVDYVISNKAIIRQRQQTLKEFNYRKLQSFLIIQNLYVLLLDSIVQFYDLQTSESYSYELNQTCFHLVPIKNNIYFTCAGGDNFIFEFVDDRYIFYSFFKSDNVRFQRVQTYENQTIGRSNQDKLIQLKWENNTIIEKQINLGKNIYKKYDYCIINQTLCLIYIDFYNVVTFDCDSVTTYFEFSQFIKVDNLDHDTITQIQFIDDQGNVFVKTAYHLYFFQFRSYQQPIYYGKVLHLNEKAQIKQCNNQYFLMLQTYQQVRLYKFSLSELQNEIYYKINIQFQEGIFQEIIMFVYDGQIVLQYVYKNVIQLKLINFDYILESELPFGSQELKIKLQNGQFHEKLTLLIEQQDFYNSYLYPMFIIFLIIIFFAFRFKLLNKEKNQH